MSEHSFAANLRAIFNTGWLSHEELVKLRQTCIKVGREFGESDGHVWAARMCRERIVSPQAASRTVRMTPGKMAKLTRKYYQRKISEISDRVEVVVNEDDDGVVSATIFHSGGVETVTGEQAITDRLDELLEVDGE